MPNDNIIVELLDRTRKLVDSLPISDYDKEDLKNALTVTIYANIVEKLFDYMNAQKPIHPAIEEVRHATTEELDKFEDNLIKLFNELPPDKNRALTHELLFTSGKIIGMGLKPLLDALDPDKRQQAYQTLNLPEIPPEHK